MILSLWFIYGADDLNFLRILIFLIIPIDNTEIMTANGQFLSSEIEYTEILPEIVVFHSVSGYNDAGSD